jgi:hypothetical protein
MKLNQIVTTILFVCSLLSLQAQVKYHLTSGQDIIVFEDGSWEKAVQSIEEDTTGMLMMEVNPMSVPVEQKYALDDNHAQAIDLLLQKAEKNEVQYFLLKAELEKRLSASELSLTQAKQMKNKEGEKQLKEEIKSTELRIKAAEKLYKNAGVQIASINGLQDLNAKNRDKQIMSLGLDLDLDMMPYMSIMPEQTEEKVSTEKEIVKGRPECKIAIDDNTGKQRIIEMGSELFYTYTPEKLKNYFKAKDLLVTDAKIKKEGKKIILGLHISIMSKDAAKNYGIIEIGSMLRVFFVSGKSVTAYSKDTAVGRLENYTGNVIYEVDYVLEGETLAGLERNPIDNIGIMWSSGYESYVVYNVDVIMHQLDCLNSL